MTENTENTMIDKDLIDQDNERGPGGFLKISYVIIVAFCLYYLFTFWDFQSDYSVDQEKIKAEISQNQE